MPAADTWRVDDDGFTLVELLVVLVVVSILLAIAVGFQTGARERANEATAKSNIRTAMPAIEAYRADNGTYAGMTVAALQSQYSPGVEGISVVSVGAATYCVIATVGGTAWYKAGPGEPITQAACS